MTNKIEFEVALLRAGKTRADVAEALGITIMGLYKKVENITDFKASEIEKLKVFLSLSNETRDSIFFAS